MLGLLIPLIREVSPFLSRIISYESPLAKKVIHEIADYFDGSPDDPEELSQKIQDDPQSSKKILEIEMKFKDFSVSVKTEHEVS